MVDGRYQPFESGPDATIEAQSVFARVKRGGEMEEPSQAKEGHHNPFAQSSASFFFKHKRLCLSVLFLHLPRVSISGRASHKSSTP